MDNEIKAWLYDILNAIMEIDSFFIDIPKNFQPIKMIFVQEEQYKEILKL